MPRTPLAQLVRSLFQTAQQAQVRKLPVDAVIADRQERRSTRREFLGHSAQVGALALGTAALGSSIFPVGAANPSARVVIVGAGLAGLTCAYRLRAKGIRVAA
jgi:monoamine oxidase